MSLNQHAGPGRDEAPTTLHYMLRRSSSSWSSALEVFDPPFGPIKNSADYFTSLLVPNHCPTLPTIPYTSSLPLPLASFRHRRADRHSICASPTHRLRFAHGSMSSAVLERWVSGHGRSNRHDFGLDRGGYRNVLRHSRRGAHARE